MSHTMRDRGREKKIRTVLGTECPRKKTDGFLMFHFFKCYSIKKEEVKR